MRRITNILLAYMHTHTHACTHARTQWYNTHHYTTRGHTFHCMPLFRPTTSTRCVHLPGHKTLNNDLNFVQSDHVMGSTIVWSCWSFSVTYVWLDAIVQILLTPPIFTKKSLKTLNLLHWHYRPSPITQPFCNYSSLFVPLLYCCC